MKRTKDELVSSVKAMLGDNPTDEGIALLEDVADSVDTVDVSEYVSQIETLKAEKAQLDADWKAKYVSRFGASEQAAPATDTTDDDIVEDADSVTDDDIAAMF